MKKRILFYVACIFLGSNLMAQDITEGAIPVTDNIPIITTVQPGNESYTKTQKTSKASTLQTIHYVKPVASGTGDGSSWANAASDLRSVLLSSSTNDQVWVAKGTYYPTATTDRTIRMEMPSGVKLYGGFAGTEIAVSQRNIELNPTIISGDIGVIGDSTDNSLRLMYIANGNINTVVDGFSFKNAAGNEKGLYTKSTSLNKDYSFAQYSIAFTSISGQVQKGDTIDVCSTAANLTGKIALVKYGSCIANLKALNLQNAGAIAVIFYSASSTSITVGSLGPSNTIPVIGISQADGLEMLNTLNSGENISVTIYSGSSGGGILIDGGSPKIKNCKFIRNRSSWGSAIYAFNSTPVIKNCLFESNFAKVSGSIYFGYSNATVEDCIFENNNAAWGGGIFFANSNYTLGLKRSSFIHNITTNYGGGIDIASYLANAEIDSCYFNQNESYGGGAIASWGNILLHHSEIMENKATGGGAGFWCYGGTTNYVSNCFFYKNSSKNIDGTIGSGGGIQVGNSTTSITVNSSLLTENKAFGTSDDGGGGIMIYGGTLNLNNSTLTNNSSETKGGGIHVFNSNGTLNVNSSIVWNNTGGTTGTEGIVSAGTTTVAYSDIQGTFGSSGVGNISSDPLFVNTGSILGSDGLSKTIDDGLVIQRNSPCVNGGDPAQNVMDITNNPMYFHEMGAYGINRPGPLALPATNVSATGFTCNWEKVDNIDNYQIVISGRPDFKDTISAFNALASAVSYLYTDASPCQILYFHIRSVKNNVPSQFSNTIKVSKVPLPNALNFDGVNDYVAVPQIGTGISAFTIETWIKPSAFSSNDFNCIYNSNSWEIGAVHFQFLVGKLVLGVNGSSYIPDPYLNYTFTQNTWYHVAVSYNGAEVKFYINGKIIDTKSLTNSTTVNLKPARIGSWSGNSGTRYFNGNIDEFRIWNTVRSADEISQNYLKELVGNESGLLTYYNFNQGIPGGNNSTVTTLTNLTDNTKNGTVTSFTLNGTTSNWVEGCDFKSITSLTASNILRTGFTLNWSEHIDYDNNKYMLDISETNDFSTLVTGYNLKDCGTFLTIPVIGLKPNTTYYCRIRVLNTKSGFLNGTIQSVTVKTLADKISPVISWSDPANIIQGTLLSSLQLNASCINGTFIYTPPTGTLLAAGNRQELNVFFTPPDEDNYSLASKSVYINVINTNLSLNNLTVSNGTSECFNAIDSITVAGNSTTIVCESGSSVNFIAGKSIRFLPGFHAQQGSEMKASISINGTFCEGVSPSHPAIQPELKSKEDKTLPEIQSSKQEEKSIKVYPNPNNGQFTLEFTNIESGAAICIYNMLGARVYQTVAMNEVSHKINLPGIKSGIYFVKVMDGKEQFTRKMVVN